MKNIDTSQCNLRTKSLEYLQAKQTKKIKYLYLGHAMGKDDKDDIQFCYTLKGQTRTNK